MSTKILATIGPSSLNRKTLSKLEENGVDLFRINLSHTRLEDLKSVMEKILNWSSVPICLDSEGAQIRNQEMISDKVFFKKGGFVNIHKELVKGDSHNISFTPFDVFNQLIVGDVIYIDFHSVALRVKEVGEEISIAEVICGGQVGMNKAVNIEREIELKPITKKDAEAFNIGKEFGVENYSLSFTNCAEDVLQVRKIIGKSNLISKIESIRGVINLSEILPFVDQILIDRGDLSREVNIEKIPFLQRRIIAQSVSKQVPVFVATNLLESMIINKSPTRAEVNDIASTLLMGANGLVLAAETAIGKHPVEAVKMVKAVIKQFEKWTPESSSSDIIY